MPSPTTTPPSLKQVLEVIATLRDQRVVITTMASIATWREISNSPLDFHYIPSAMGHAPDLGLGLALAQPKSGVIVLNGDGSTLMNLGSLVTIANHRVPLYVLILDNGIYEVTGGQPTAGAGRADFAALARAAGIARVYAFDSLDGWKKGAAEALSGPGPVVICLKIEARLGEKSPSPPRPMAEQIAALQNALGVQPVTPPPSTQ
jgi:thiamine pyrophosphate-dependent acetolactate synthase large subunit-like protein